MKSHFSDSLRYIVIVILRMFLKVFFLFPIKKNRIVFNSFQGKQFSCNPKYIFLGLKERYDSDIEYIWIRNEEDYELDKYTSIKIVKFLSIKFYYYVLTSGVYITNNAIEPFLPKRKSQLFINTWHGGGAYKKAHKFYDNDKILKKRMLYRSQITDYIISSCRVFSEVSSSSWYININKFLPIGMPRNDYLINNKENIQIKNAIKQQLKIPKDCKVILYAPTFRGLLDGLNATNVRKFDIDLDRVRHSVENKYNTKFIVLYRCHHSMCQMMVHYDNAIDVSSYPDTQELLLVTDVLITDYSSIIWDFSFLNKPCFLFTPDLPQYLNDNGFYVPIDLWPFDYAFTNDELVKIIENFKLEECEYRIMQHHQKLGTYEKGLSTGTIVELIGAYCFNSR